jgi:hypothetical protein
MDNWLHLVACKFSECDQSVNHSYTFVVSDFRLRIRNIVRMHIHGAIIYFLRNPMEGKSLEWSSEEI